MNTSVEQLWDDYIYWYSRTSNYQRLKGANPYYRLYKATPERLAVIQGMRIWCEVRGFAVRQWLFTLFAVRRWMFAPKLATPDLCSVKHIPKYEKWENYDLYTKRLRDLEAAKPVTLLGTQFDPNRDLNRASELAKKAYLDRGQEAECIRNMNTETFGYHPGSVLCATCQRSRECEALLVSSVNFDIMALRRGEITSEEAYRSALQVKGYAG